MKLKVIVTTILECNSYTEAFGEIKNRVQTPHIIGKNEDKLIKGEIVQMSTRNTAKKSDIVNTAQIIKQ